MTEQNKYDNNNKQSIFIIPHYKSANKAYCVMLKYV